MTELRTYAVISKEDFLQKYRDNGGYDAVPATVYNDWALMAEFDLENCDSEVGGWSPDYSTGQTDLLYGIQTIGDFTFCGYIVGGDWETPIFALAYWDGEHYRGYVPIEGNCLLKQPDGRYIAHGNVDDIDDLPAGADFRDHAKMRDEIMRVFNLKETV